MQAFDSLERRRRRPGGGGGGGGEDPKQEVGEPEDDAGSPTTPHSTGVGVSTRRTTYVTVSGNWAC